MELPEGIGVDVGFVQPLERVVLANVGDVHGVAGREWFLSVRSPYYRGNRGSDEEGDGGFNTEDSEDAEGTEEIDG